VDLHTADAAIESWVKQTDRDGVFVEQPSFRSWQIQTKDPEKADREAAAGRAARARKDAEAGQLWWDGEPWIPEKADLVEAMLNDVPGESLVRQLLKARDRVASLEGRAGTERAELELACWNRRVSLADGLGMTATAIRAELRSLEKEISMANLATPKQVAFLESLIQATGYPHPVPRRISFRDAQIAIKVLVKVRDAMPASPEQVQKLKELYHARGLDPRQVPADVSRGTAFERIQQLAGPRFARYMSDGMPHDPEAMPMPRWDVQTVS